MSSPALDVFAYPFMVHALIAGSIVAVTSGVIGWFMVIRRQTFAGHAITLAAFPGAAGAALLGWNTTAGYFLSCLAIAWILALSTGRSTERSRTTESAAIGTLLAFLLACGYLFAALSGTLLSETTQTLFGFVFGISNRQITVLALTSAVILLALGMVFRPLFFTSIDPIVAASRGLSTGVLGVVFLSLLALTGAQTTQITGALLAFPLLVLPPAIARDLTSSPQASLVTSILIGLGAVWIGLIAAYYTSYPSGFCVTTPAFVAFVVVRTVRGRRPSKRATEVA